jgi:hypothetical protein
MADSSHSHLQRRLTKAFVFTSDRTTKDGFSAGLWAPTFLIWHRLIGGTESDQLGYSDALEWQLMTVPAFAGTAS